LWIQEFSAGGNQILFVDFSPDEENLREGRESGTIVALSANPRMKVVNAVTGATRLIRNDVCANTGSITSDSRYIVYNKWKTGVKDEAKLYIYDTLTGEDRYLTEGICPDISPDNRDVIFTTEKQEGISDRILRIPLAGGTPEILKSFTSEDEIHKPCYVQYSPDGQWILFAATYRDFKDTSGYYHDPETRYRGICVMKISECKTYMISPNTSDLVRGYIRWSPDGKKICYTVYYFEKRAFKSGIHVLDFNPDEFQRVAKTDVTESSKPVGFGIVGNYPNPFNASTVIECTLPQSGYVELIIFNSMGQKIRKLAADYLNQGKHTFLWDGRTDRGSPVSSGIYISRISMAGKVSTRRMTLVK
jgi:Tol biopolymer transport system component